LQQKFKTSERRACRAIGQHRSTNRYVALPTDFETRLVARMVELAEANPKWGYRLVHGLLVDEGWAVNKKRIERLWRREGLQLPPQKKKPTGGTDLGGDEFSIWRLPPRYPNHIWTYDFIKRRTADGRPLRVLNVMDEYTRVALGSHCARSIGAREVRRHLTKLFAEHGKPAIIRADNGREFIANLLREWLATEGVRGVFIAKAKPWQNGYMERFNGTVEREVFGNELYHSVLEAQVVLDMWIKATYNTRRRHRGLRGQTPAGYAKMIRNETTEERNGGGE
jgi:putative transposase